MWEGIRLKNSLSHKGLLKRLILIVTQPFGKYQIKRWPSCYDSKWPHRSYHQVESSMGIRQQGNKAGLYREEFCVCAHYLLLCKNYPKAL